MGSKKGGGVDQSEVVSGFFLKSLTANVEEKHILPEKTEGSKAEQSAAGKQARWETMIG